MSAERNGPSGMVPGCLAGFILGFIAFAWLPVAVRMVLP